MSDTLNSDTLNGHIKGTIHLIKVKLVIGISDMRVDFTEQQLY